MRIEKMASKTDVMVKLVLVFFISLLSFSIGTFVGKKYSDNQHQLAALEPSKTSSEEAHGERAVASVGAEGEKNNTMSDDEIAKLAEEFVADDTATTTASSGHGEEHGAAATTEHGTEHNGEVIKANAPHGAPNVVQAPPPAAGHGAATVADAKADAHKPMHGNPAETPVKKSVEPSSVAKNLATGKEPVATTEKSRTATAADERRPSSLPKDVAAYSVGKFTVQVAAYTDEAEAQKMASDLKTKGYSAFYIPATVKGKIYYRVSVGQFATPKEAQSYRGELMSKAKLNSAIVQKITE
jgi:cell division septation protein DedD